MHYLNAWHFRNCVWSLEEAKLKDGVRRGQKKHVNKSKTPESFWGIAEKHDIEKGLLKCNRRRKRNGILIWVRHLWGAWSSWALRQRLQEAQGATFSFPLSSGLVAVLSETLRSGLSAINNHRMPVQADFRSQIHSTLHQHFVLGRACLHPGPLGEQGCRTSLPSSTQGQAGRKQPLAELWGRRMSWSERGTASLRWVDLKEK